MVTLRPIQLREIDMVAKWVEQEGWVFDASAFQVVCEAYPDTCIVAELPNKDIAGFAGLIPFTEDLGIIVTVIVREDVRGKGIGKHLVGSYSKYLGDRNVWLHSEPNKEQFYIKLGIAIMEFKFQKYVIRTCKSAQDTAGAVNNVFIHKDSTGEFITKIVDFEQRLLGFNRQSFLEGWSRGQDCFVATENDAVVGYLFARLMHVKSTNVIYAAPFTAENDDIANSLFASLVAHFPPGSLVKIRCPTQHKAIAAIVEKHNVIERQEGYTMFSRKLNVLPFQKIYSFFPF